MSGFARAVAAVYDRRIRALGGHRPPLQGQAVATRAFTLIELMIVIGLIILLVSGLSLSLGDTAGNSLASAQNLLGSQLGAARAQAAVKQTEARLLVYATQPPAGDAEKFLRMIRVVYAETPGSASTRWIAVGPPTFLPRGSYIVPNPVTRFLEAGVIWSTNPAPVSTLLAATRMTIVGDPPGADTYFAIEWKPDGTIATLPGNPPYAKLAVATAAGANNLPSFNNPGAVRGVIIRPSGAVTFVNDATAF